MELNAVYKCEICGNAVIVVDDNTPPIVCCDQEMEKLEAQTEDSSVEKHVPVVEESEKGVKVTVGSTLHPMTSDHQIVFIEVFTNDDIILRKQLSPEDKPVAEFPVEKSKVKKVREYCNIHDLWKA